MLHSSECSGILYIDQASLELMILLGLPNSGMRGMSHHSRISLRHLYLPARGAPGPRPTVGNGEVWFLPPVRYTNGAESQLSSSIFLYIPRGHSICGDLVQLVRGNC